jgi:hypothetical protein
MMQNTVMPTNNARKLNRNGLLSFGALGGSASIAPLSFSTGRRRKPARSPRGVAIVAACPTPSDSIRRAMLTLLG